MERIGSDLSPSMFMFKSSWRLNRVGFVVLLKQSKHFQYDTEKLTNRHKILLSQHVSAPFFISANSMQLYLFSDEEAVIISLCGNLRRWLELKEC